MDTTIKEAKRTLKRYHDNAASGLKEFTRILQESPVNAFEWSAPAFKAAAQHAVTGILLRDIEGWEQAKDPIPEEEAVKNLLSLIERRVLEMARHPDRSASSQHNEMHRCLTEAWAEMVYALGGPK